MRRTINSTGRRRIERGHVRISLRAPAPGGGSVRFEPTFDLAGLGLPAEGRIVVEAYRHEATERFAFGTVAAPRPEDEPELRELTAERLAFRVKVVDPASHRLLALARRLPPVGDDGDRDRRRELFRVRTAELGEELWRVVVDEDDAPWLELNRDVPDVLPRFRQPELRAAILPAAMRTVLLELAMRDADADQEDDPDSWIQRWLHFAEGLTGEDWLGPEAADAAERQRWIDRACAAFAARHGLTRAMLAAISQESLT